MSMVDKIADCLVEDHVELMNENQRLKRENSILRSEFKILLVHNNVENYDMSEDAAEEDAEKWLTHLVAHNEGGA
jgi:hypothetical protein